MSLAGYNPLPPYGREGPNCPSTFSLKPIQDAMEETDLKKLDNMMDSLFKVSQPDLQKDGRNRPLLECIFATHLVALPEVMANCGDAHPVAVRMMNMAKDFGVSKADLTMWGAAIQADKELRSQRLVLRLRLMQRALMVQRLVLRLRLM